jgi:glycosyltransferase involved in cell wall biosynthesis
VAEVSVVVPTRDRSGLLHTTLRSLLAQTGVELEVVVVDDGSADSTSAVVVGFHDSRLRAVQNAEPHGVSRARNRGIVEATGRWISFCDDDDVWAPDKLEKQLTSARREKRDWAYCGVVNVDDNLRPVSAPPVPSPDEVVARLPHYNAIPGGGSNVVVRRELLDRAGPFDPQLRNTEDWEMWLRLSRLGPPAAAQRRLVGYRLHHGNASLDVAEILNGVRRIEQLHHTHADRGRIHRWLAESCLRTGNRGQALGHWAVAAANGQVAAVLADLGAVLSRRIGTRGRRHDLGVRQAEWAVQARQWLEVLARTDPRSVQQ